MWTDPIVEKLHRIREAHAASFGNDLRKVAESLKEIEKQWPAPKVSPPSKPPLAKGRVISG
jgi:hypothetical protein